MKIEIKNYCNSKVIFSMEAESLKVAVEAAIKAHISLSYADLRFTDLRSADLRSADLRSANLQSADLQSADLRSADLRSADLRSADLRSADLRSANLQSADLQSADLRSADLRSADLRSAGNIAMSPDTKLQTGETWGEYVNEVVPALLTAGGKPLEAAANEKTWACHSWKNCPMAEAFGVHDINDVPTLWRYRAEQFVQFFDAGLIPLPNGKEGKP